jgi:hypothetical protein
MGWTIDTVSRPDLGPTQPPIQWVPGDLSLGVMQLEGEADHSPPSSAEVKECVELYLSSLNKSSRYTSAMSEKKHENLRMADLWATIQHGISRVLSRFLYLHFTTLSTCFVPCSPINFLRYICKEAVIAQSV